MAPSLATAEGAYEHAAYRLRAACTLVERHLPNPEVEEEVLAIPPLRPRQQVSGQPCAQCEAERENLEEDSEEVIECTHGTSVGQIESEHVAPKKRAPGKRQPNPGVIRQDVNSLDQKFDTFTVALATLCSLYENQEQMLYESHLVLWADYVGWMKDRAEDVMARGRPILFNRLFLTDTDTDLFSITDTDI